MANESVPLLSAVSPEESAREKAEEGRRRAESERGVTEDHRNSTEAVRDEAERFRRLAEEARGRSATSIVSAWNRFARNARACARSAKPPGLRASSPVPQGMRHATRRWKR